MSTAVLAEPVAAVRPASCPARTRIPWRRAVPLLVALVLLGPSVAWIFRDHAVWSFDPAWYGEVSCDLWFYLRRQRAEWLPALTHAFRAKAPGIAWLGQFFVPLGKYVGSIDRALLLSVLLPQLLTLLLVWRMARALCPDRGWWPPLAGCLAVASAPLFVGFSHLYFVEPLQTFAVAWVFYAAVCGRRWDRVRLLAHLLAASCVGVLAKTATPLYCLLPGLIATTYLFRRPTGSRPGWISQIAHVLFLAASLVLAYGTFLWYRANLEQVREHMRQSAVGEVSLAYGHVDTFVNKLVWWFAAFRTGIVTPWAFWGVAGLVGAGLGAWCLRLYRNGWRATVSLADAIGLAALGQCAIILVVMSRMITETPRFLLPAAPAFALVVLWALARLQARAVAVVVALAFLVQWADMHAVALGLEAPRPGYDLAAPNRDAQRSQEIARAVALTSAGPGANRYSIVGYELGWFNANSFGYYASQERLRTGVRGWYTSLGYAETDVNRAAKRIREFQTVFFLSLEPEARPRETDIFNRVSAPITQRIARDPDFEPQPFASTQGIVIYRRVPSRPAVAARHSPQNSQIKKTPRQADLSE